MKDPEILARQMTRRGWTWQQIGEAIRDGARHPAVNKETGGSASRYVHPVTGRSVVLDDVSGTVIHVGGDDFRYPDDPRSPAR